MTPRAKQLLQKIERDIEIELARDRRNRVMIDAMKCAEANPVSVSTEEILEIWALYDEANRKADRLDDEGITDESHDAYLVSLMEKYKISYRKFAQIVPTSVEALLAQFAFEHEMRKSDASFLIAEEAPPAFDIAAASLMAKRAA